MFAFCRVVQCIEVGFGTELVHVKRTAACLRPCVRLRIQSQTYGAVRREALCRGLKSDASQAFQKIASCYIVHVLEATSQFIPHHAVFLGSRLLALFTVCLCNTCTLLLPVSM